MYRITIITVGKLKEKYLRAGVREYSKRLESYAKVKIHEVSDESVPENASRKELSQAMEKEAERIKTKIPSSSYLICCDLDGEQFTSEEFADKISKLALYGNSNLCFVIGGSVGIHPSLLKESSLKISFGKLTFPHQLMRVILLEQIYRAMRIINNEPYHK